MSGPARATIDDRDDPSLDAGILADAPLIEFNGSRAVLRHGGLAVLPWRGDHLAATRLGIATTPMYLGDGTMPRFSQALVRVRKGRAVTFGDLVDAWRALEDGGQLLVTGTNDLGIVTWCRRVGEACPGIKVLANHSHARIARAQRPGACPQAWLEHSGGGLFNHGQIDSGTAVLIAQLSGLPTCARVLDLGCGQGHLGFAALACWPSAEVCFLDADARAVAAVKTRIEALNARQARVAWWDVGEAMPETSFDLVLCNPPCHAGIKVDLGTARLMFTRAAQALRPGGRLVAVANRTLPYESDLAWLGRVEQLAQTNAFKVLSVTVPGPEPARA